MRGKRAFLATLALCGMLAACASGTNVPPSPVGRTVPPPHSNPSARPVPTIPPAYEHPPGVQGTTELGLNGGYIQSITMCLQSGRVCLLS
jgi:hypothetical protein